MKELVYQDFLPYVEILCAATSCKELQSQIVDASFLGFHFVSPHAYHLDNFEAHGPRGVVLLQQLVHLLQRLLVIAAVWLEKGFLPAVVMDFSV
jgi:hypothetical protein